jgi:zinc D-Ala-D-Ala dipeptidase
VQKKTRANSPVKQNPFLYIMESNGMLVSAVITLISLPTESLAMSFKVTNPFCKIRLIFSIFLTFHAVLAVAQDSSKTALKVVHNWKEYHAQVLHDSTKKMVNLSVLIPGIKLDLRYASENNFMHRQMYAKGTSQTYLRLPAAIALKAIQQELQKDGLALKIFDAYRPYAVTLLFWELVNDERYVANPAKGSGHNRGIAVDLTIIDQKTGVELDMGTGFDNFTDTAHQSFTALPDNIIKNRKLLRTVMEKYRFVPLETEWWHYYLKDGARFEVLDIPFKNMK